MKRFSLTACHQVSPSAKNRRLKQPEDSAATAATVAMEATAEDHRVRSSLEGAEVLGPEVVGPRVPVVVWGVGEVWGVLAVEPWKLEVTGEWWTKDQGFGKTGFNSPPASTLKTVPTIHSVFTAPVPRPPLLVTCSVQRII